MCGIVGFVRKQKALEEIDIKPLLEFLNGIDVNTLVSFSDEQAALLKELAKQSISLSGQISLIKYESARKEISKLASDLRVHVEQELLSKSLSESTKEKFLLLNDSFWRIEKDACTGAEQTALLLSKQQTSLNNIPSHIIAVYRSINLVLRSIDRIEVRGRDSAGISVALSSLVLDQKDKDLLTKRKSSVFGNLSARIAKDPNGNDLAYFVYKRAAEIGELGDNVAFIRDAISNDELLYDLVLRNTQIHETVLAHTRWASMGVISEENTHPLDSTELEEADETTVVLGALNGDIDNHNALRSECSIDKLITTDAKLIPVLMRHEKESDQFDAFRKVVGRFEGSTAIAALTSRDPNNLYLALRGGGQGLFIGLGEDEYIVASEPYGVVEISSEYVRVDGETPNNPNQPLTSRGQVFSLNVNNAGSIQGLRRDSYDGVSIELSDSDVIQSEVTTRDIDRGDFEHYLWKEINEAPKSFAATLSGKFESSSGIIKPVIDESIIPNFLKSKVESGKINSVLVIGQGTAAVAGQACAYFFKALGSKLEVNAFLATEVSGFMLQDDMSNTLVIAVSQSGTTTDTNRTVDLLRDRGASVIAIVNRRGSDLTTKSDGVCYTSSGRDVEMSVASTKAFYAQVAAGAYLAIAIESIQTETQTSLVTEIVKELQQIPDYMRQVLANRDQIANVAHKNILSRRSWATVGNGSNVIAAREIRIKSSELCYKAIAMDSTEDKKHIDLSSEPLIIVCATGLVGSTADDVAKEVAIYKAHKACPVVITDDASERFDESGDVIRVPKTHVSISFILATVAGHIFGYESARAIDNSAKILREARGALGEITPEELASSKALDIIGEGLRIPATKFFDAVSERQYDAILDASDATNLTQLFIALTPPFMPELLKNSCGGLSTPEVLTTCAVSTLTRAIDQLTRPIDAIRHQAKTVTVGISRSDDTLLKSESVSYLLDSGVERDHLQFPVIRTLLALDEMVASINGHTRYSIEGDPRSGQATVSVIEQKGSASDLTSRVQGNPSLRGTKSLTAREQVVWITKGKSDGRNVILIPEVSRGVTTGITLLHIDVKEEIDIEARKRILEGYKQRLFALRDAVTETQDTFDEAVLQNISIIDLLTEPVVVLAQNWNQS